MLTENIKELADKREHKRLTVNKYSGRTKEMDRKRKENEQMVLKK